MVFSFETTLNIFLILEFFMVAAAKLSKSTKPHNSYEKLSDKQLACSVYVVLLLKIVKLIKKLWIIIFFFFCICIMFPIFSLQTRLQKFVFFHKCTPLQLNQSQILQFYFSFYVGAWNQRSRLFFKLTWGVKKFNST